MSGFEAALGPRLGAGRALGTHGTLGDRARSSATIAGAREPAVEPNRAERGTARGEAVARELKMRPVQASRRD